MLTPTARKEQEASAKSEGAMASKETDGQAVDELVHICKQAIPRPESGLDPDKLREWEGEVSLWDSWKERWKGFYEDWMKADEEQATLVARQIRKLYKGKESAAKINEMVKMAVSELATKRKEIPPFVLPAIEGEYLPELLTLRKKRVRVAQKRMQDFLAKLSQDQKAEDELAISKATLAAAKARVLGRPHRYSLVLCSDCAYYLRKM
jgi:hypothetical protein